MPRRRLVKRLPGRLTRAAAPTSALAMGSMGYGSGGSLWQDAFRTKRAPTPTELVNEFRSVAYVCTKLNANGVARVPLRLYATTSRGQRKPRRAYQAPPHWQMKYIRGHDTYRAMIGAGDQVDEITDHPFVAALRRPNPFFDGHQFLFHQTACLDVTGCSYFNTVRPDPTDAGWASGEWWPFMSQYVLPVKGTCGRILDGWTFFGQTFVPEEIVRTRFISLRDPYLSGYGPLQAMYEQCGLGNYYFATVEDILEGGAQLGLLATPKDPKLAPGEIERKRYQADLNNSLTRGNKARVLVTNGAYDFTQYSMPAEDLAGLEISKETRLYVANAFDVPISLLQAEDSNRAVAEAGNYQHQRNAIEPRCTMIAASLTAMAQQVDRRLFFAFDCPVEDDRERSSKIIDLALKNGSRTINEVRAEDGLEPVPYGDEPWLPNTLIQPSAAAQAREHAQGLAEKAAEKPEPDGDEEPDPAPEGDDKAEADRAYQRAAWAFRETVASIARPEPDDATTYILDRLGRILDSIEAEHAPPPGDDPDPGRGDAPPPTLAQEGRGERAEAGSGGEAQHLWASDGGSDQGGAAEVVREATEGGTGDGADDRDGAAVPLPQPG